VQTFVAWAVGIGFTVWACRMLWKARRDAQLKTTIAAGMAGDVADPDVPSALGADSSEPADDAADGGD
jgi:hypothetical protein